METVVETPPYLRDAGEAGVSEDERSAIVDLVSANPEAGDLIPATGGARKLRVAGRSKGKSGGYRIITYSGDADMPVFLLALFAKGDRADLSMAERNMLGVLTKRLLAAYRR